MLMHLLHISFKRYIVFIMGTKRFYVYTSVFVLCTEMSEGGQKGAIFASNAYFEYGHKQINE